MRVRGALGAFAALVCSHGGALAAAPADITWNTPPGSPCPAQATVVAEVERLLGSGREGGRQPLRAVADVSQDARGLWHVKIAAGYGEATDTRELHAPTCGTVAGATALVIAMMIEPLMVGDLAPADLGSGPAPPPLMPAPLPPPALPPPPPLPPPRPPAPLEEEELATFVFGVHVTGNIGVLPVPAVAFGPDIGGMLGRFRFDVGMSWLPKRQILAESHPSAGVELTMITGHATGTFIQWREPLEIGWQLGIDIGSLRGEGFGVRRSEAGSTAWVAPRLGVLAAYPIAAFFAVRANLAFSFAGIRPTYQIAGVGDVYEVAGPVGDLALAAELRL
jgi:hypothetical protein